MNFLKDCMLYQSRFWSKKMKVSNLLKIAAGVSTVGQNIAASAMDKGHRLVDEHFLHGKYVTREEFDNLKELVIKLEQRLASLQK